MKQSDVEAAMPTVCERWANDANQPWPPDGKYHYSFSHFWSWLENHHRPYTQFRAVPNPRDVAEIWFDRIMKQGWRS